jgi:hypothetical protein
MSYEKVKKITIDKVNRQVRICSACNNLRPLTYEYWTLKAETLDEAIGKTLMYMWNGELHLSEKDKTNVKWNYALMKIREKEELRKKFIELNYGYTNNKEELEKMILTFAAIFKTIEAKKEKYIMRYNEYAYVKKFKGRYIYTTWYEDEALVFKNNIEAEWFKNLYPNYELIKLG